MSYLKIGNIDFSKYVNELNIEKNVNFTSQLNAAGNTVVDYINSKRVIEVGFIPLDSEAMKEVLDAIEPFNVLISFRNPKTNTLEEGVNCIVPTESISYYTIQVNKVTYKAFKIQFNEL